MNELKKRFVDQLVAADSPTSEARQRYEKEMQIMFERKLTRYQEKEYLVVGIIMGLIGSSIAIVYGLNVFIEWPLRALPGRPELKFALAFFLLTAAALLAVAAICFRSYWRGLVSRRTSNGATGTAVLYVGVLGCLFLLMARHIPEMLRDEVRVLGMALLAFAVVVWLRHCIVRAEMRTAEKLLEIELRLAEIGEALEGKSRPTETAAAQQPVV